MEQATLLPEILKTLYRTMLLIRRVEETISVLHPEQEMRCPIHLSIGQEAPAAGLGAHLKATDYLWSTHRCHAHYLAKGGSVEALFAELYGKATGCAGGRAGSMHLVSTEAGMMGASAVVGSSIPLAVGAALAAKMRGEDKIAVACFGDAATETGVFHESMSFASLHSLPIIFFCENNLYSVMTRIDARQVADDISARAAAYHMPGVRVDGNDVLAVYRAVEEAASRARGGAGPTLIECRTYRWREHCGPNFDYGMGTRTREELAQWMAHCPLRRMESALDAHGIDAVSRAEMREEIDRNIDRAADAAQKAPFPEPASLFAHVY